MLQDILIGIESIMGDMQGSRAVSWFLRLEFEKVSRRMLESELEQPRLSG